MYRHSASLNLGQHSLPSPASDGLSDTEAEITMELKSKQRQIDDDIARFKEQKEKEFREFEADLRNRRKRQRSPRTSPRKTPSSPKSTPLSLLATVTKSQANGSVHKHNHSVDGPTGPRSKTAPPPSQPTLSLDRLTINGTTTPPVVGTPPTNNALVKSLSRSPTNYNMALTPPRSRPPKWPSTPSTQDRNDTTFAGLFTPAYLPLLESRDRTPPKVQPTSMGLPSISEPLEAAPQSQLSSSLPHKSSLTSSPTQSKSLDMKRSLTAPIIPSTSLPSALRTASGSSMRKRKHVTFQLADSAIVEPSSSYEEVPSPDPGRDESGSGSRDGTDEVLEQADVVDQGRPRRKDEREREAESNSTLDSITLPPSALSPNLDQVFTGHQQLKQAYEDASDEFLNPRQRSGSTDSVASGSFINGLSEADDGGSGVGFFELDEELESPGTGERKEYDHIEDVVVDDVTEKPGGRTNGRATGKGKVTENDEMQHGSFSAGSVPIDIGRRSSSMWVGSYGH